MKNTNVSYTSVAKFSNEAQEATCNVSQLTASAKICHTIVKLIVSPGYLEFATLFQK